MRTPTLRHRRWTRVEYDRLVARGFFSAERIELLDGALVVHEPQGGRHARTVIRARKTLERVFGRGYHVRDQMPIALDDVSEPEPDVFVVRGTQDDYGDEHPSSAVLLVEVADSSIPRDRLNKGGIYARAGIAEYWILNVVDDVLEVYRQPVRAAQRRHGWKYGSVRLLKRGAVVSPLAAPRVKIRVADLLPPAS